MKTSVAVVACCLITLAFYITKDRIRDDLQIAQESVSSPFEEAMNIKKRASEIDYLEEQFKERQLNIIISDEHSEEVISFAKQLLEDSDLQKAIMRYSNERIGVLLWNKFEVYGEGGYVIVDIRKGVKEVTKWLNQ
ncbi:hypothetical protein ACFLY5_00135 [Patescibacteria group bacterium]